jgi:hypothetical protein
MMAKYGGLAHVMQEVDIHDDSDTGTIHCAKIIQQLEEIAMSKVDKSTGDEFVKRVLGTGINIFKLSRIYNGVKDIGIARMRVRICEAKLNVIRDELYKVIPQLSKIIYRYENKLIVLIDDMRKVKYENDIVISNDDLNYLNDFSQTDIEIMKTTYDLIIGLTSVHRTKAAVLNNLNAIETTKYQSVHEPVEPAINIRASARSDAAKMSAQSEEYMWK